MYKKTFLILMFLAFSAAWVSAEEGREIVAMAVSGPVEFQKAGQGEWSKLGQGNALSQTDVVRTGDNASCTLLFKGMSNATVDLRPNSMLELTSVRDARTGDNTELDLSLGAVLVKAETLKGESSFEVRTPNSIVGIRGTEFEVTVD